jgi:DNA ligase-1
VNVGGAALIAALVAATGADETHVRRRLVARGDAGDVAEEVFPPSPEPPTLTLADIEGFLDELAATAGSGKKRDLLTAMLRRCALPVEAKYLVKLLQGDLRIGLKEGAVEDALARLAGVTVEAVQRANMLTGDIGETALLARHGRLGEARMRLFHPLKFMLATPADDPEDVARQMPTSFIVEDKFDGIRAQAHVAPAGAAGEGTTAHGLVATNAVRVALFSRTLDEITESFPDLVASLASLVVSGGILLDGEIVPVDPETGAIRPFQSLQPRLGRKAPSADAQAQMPVAYVAYDILFGYGASLLDTPLSERRAALEALPFDGRAARLADSHLFSDAAALDAEFDGARARGNEGLMVKDPRSAYKPGRRGREWLKVKKALATLDVVITAAQVGEGRRSRFLSDYTFAVRASETDPTLLNVGKAYSGLTDAETQELSDWCRAHTVAEYAHGKVIAVEPQVVLEVTFDRVQASARHKSGYALRFPRILRVRTDKPPSEVDTLEAVRRLADGAEA